MEKIRHVYQHLFTKHLFITNTATVGCLLAVGDCVTQNIERISKTRSKQKGLGTDKDAWKYNWPRTGRMFSMGLVLGPFNHLWYNIVIDRLVKGTGVKVVFKKILGDQFVAAPFFCSSFFMGMGLMEGGGVEGAMAEVRKNFVTVYLMDWCVWPPAQFINFYFLPAKMRVVYVSFITLCWNTFLSYIKHKTPETERHPTVNKIS
ncbi:hypothetical protein ScPMuIL_001019 [Solemya velum]